MGNPKASLSMNRVIFSTAFATCFASNLDPDHINDLNEKEFLEFFHLDPITDPLELAMREKTLKDHEAKIKKVNEQYLKGEKKWFARVNEFADLPDDQFLAQKTGLKGSFKGGDVNSNIHRRRRSAAPPSFNAVDLGLVSPVKSQGACGSCVAFANMATIETCFAKITNGVIGDYSEQQMIDCGYGKNGANACGGASLDSYLAWAVSEEAELAHESTYPYLNTQPNLECPDLDWHNQGAKVKNYSSTSNGNENLLKDLVFEHGAVVAAVNVGTNKDLWSNYGGGVFDDCTVAPDAGTDHAVTVVGYGHDNGMDYWLVKNSWGSTWGQNGFMKLKRGVGMCGIGREIVTVVCEKVEGPTDPPLTTAIPCRDKYSNCPEMAENYCYRENFKRDCRKSCGLCEGMTPAPSNTCYDKWSNCPEMAENYCYQENIKRDCKKSCGLCEGMTPAPSNTCFDKWSNCAFYCQYPSIAKDCKKSCALC